MNRNDPVFQPIQIGETVAEASHVGRHITR